jgi:hypothetical protein
MRRRFILLWLAVIPGVVGGAGAITMPDFPLPKFAVNRYGQPEEMGMLRLYRDLRRSGVSGMENFETSDNDYAMVASESLGLFSAWLEAACKSGGIELPQARLRSYNGAVYAGLLETATNIAASRHKQQALAVPVGVMICTRRKPWGVLPGDGERDAYVLVATERGFVIFDPPTGQSSLLADYPNNSEVLRVRL